MPHNNRDFGRAVRELMQHRPGQTYTATRVELLEWMDGRDETPQEAVAIMTNPLNELLCEECGWTVGMVCPECPGCGCYTGRCSGWRHHEYMDDDARRELFEEEDTCEECGGSISLACYDAGCICD
ncbi:hypothetical protein ACFY05_32495 [Microtetraspora fusca]|uniref:Uncharacterized protein n=1 Tax=Microtetraspora fusca TaxID=1997 RepID=A0ABW6VE00_MICFU